ncbi:SDR family oxidoreductase [Bacillus sp. FJAT-49736]|uniref:SDR family oxidoreductase n=1 Tax=Bacillus sp. FJAT-49736 TaxID=2833582 RepID=UPI001BC8D3DA|nr:SDR family oxidoreductase [Bacillus sp. FJAT-49736]MBS4175563.1 SDR family oxidoreductase [Bacillus sp. FJAT-49736]
MSFSGKVVVVTGAGNGIGKAIAVTFAKKGSKVVIAEIDQAAGQQTANQIIQNGGDALFIETDVRNPEEIENLFSLVKEKFGIIDIVINNAGISRWKDPLELTVEEWDDIIHTNLRSVFLCTREAAKWMQNGGAIVNMASTRALMSEPHSEGYAASKGGIVALTHALAVSLGEKRIRVNAISPGWIETKNYALLSEADHAQHPAQRVGKPEDIARACLYLTDPDNDFITGQNIVIDGGMTVKMIYEE